MHYSYKPTGVCASNIEFDIENGIVKTIQWYLDHKDWWEEIISGEYKDYYNKMYGEE